MIHNLKSGLTALAMTLAMASPVFAQETSDQTETSVSSDDPQIDFAANAIEYDNDDDIVTAKGEVVMTREGNRVRADQISWNRKSGRVFATGRVSVTSPGGDIAYGDSVELTETLKDGVVENLLIVLTDGGRLAAKHGARRNGITTLDRAVYSPCAVEDSHGCPKDPAWKITAARVVHDPVKNRIRYKNARLEIFGLPILVLPGLSHPADNRGGSGLLVPDIKYSRNNGFEVSAPVFFKIAPNRDLTLTPHLYSGALPALQGNYRALARSGAYQIGGFATYSNRIANTTGANLPSREFRGYLDASGRFQLDKRWSVSGSVRFVTDRTFLRRYDISRDDQLRSTIDLQRLTRTSYFSISGWGFQTLRSGDPQGQVPIALPLSTIENDSKTQLQAESWNSSSIVWRWAALPDRTPSAVLQVRGGTCGGSPTGDRNCSLPASRAVTCIILTMSLEPPPQVIAEPMAGTVGLSVRSPPRFAGRSSGPPLAAFNG